MEENEQLLQKLREFKKEKIAQLKDKNPNKQVDIKDIIYYGKLDFEEDGQTIQKDVFLVIKNIDGEISMVYCTNNNEIAIQIDIAKMIDEDGIIPMEKYKHRNKDFEKLKENQENAVSLNKLEQDRINSISQTLGIDQKDIKALSQIDTKNLNKEEILRKNIDIKTRI